MRGRGCPCSFGRLEAAEQLPEDSGLSSLDGLGLLVDSIRVDARELSDNEQLMDLCESVGTAGILVIADQANWRDGEFLERIGVKAGVRMQSDC